MQEHWGLRISYTKIICFLVKFQGISYPYIQFYLCILLKFILPYPLCRYRSKFGFPFVICARKNKKDAILEGLRTRLNNSHEVELQKGLTEVKKICYLRLLDLVQHEGIESRL